VDVWFAEEDSGLALSLLGAAAIPGFQAVPNPPSASWGRAHHRVSSAALAK